MREHDDQAPPPVQRLQTRSAVGMAEGLRPELAGTKAGALCDAIEQPANVPQLPLLAGYQGG
jgi:hypothetical protein